MERFGKIKNKYAPQLYKNLVLLFLSDFDNEIKKLIGPEKNISFEKQAASKDRLGAAFNYIINSRYYLKILSSH